MLKFQHHLNMRKAKGGHPFEVIYLSMHHERCRSAILASAVIGKTRIPSDLTELLCRSCWNLLIKGLDDQGFAGKRVRVPDARGIRKWETFYVKCEEAYLAAMKKKTWQAASKMVCKRLGIAEPSFHFDAEWFGPILTLSCRVKDAKPSFRDAFRPYQWSRRKLLAKRRTEKIVDPVHSWQYYTSKQETEHRRP